MLFVIKEEFCTICTIKRVIYIDFEVSVPGYITQITTLYTYVHSYSFQRSTHSKGSEHMTLAQGLLEGQCLSKLRAMVACPH
jgi:hypothetical protein